jgi:hypothetical protein
MKNADKYLCECWNSDRNSRGHKHCPVATQQSRELYPIDSACLLEFNARMELSARVRESSILIQSAKVKKVQLSPCLIKYA